MVACRSSWAAFLSTAPFFAVPISSGIRSSMKDGRMGGGKERREKRRELM